MSLSNILCKTKNFQTWSQKCLICIILGFKFEKLLPYLKSAPTNYSSSSQRWTSLNLGQKCSFLDIFRLKSLKKKSYLEWVPSDLQKGKSCNTKSFNFGAKNVLVVQFWVVSLKKFGAKIEMLKFETKIVLLSILD